MFARIATATSTIFFSTILAAFMVVGLWVWAPGVLNQFQQAGNWLESSLTGLDLPSRVSTGLELFLDDTQLTFAIFIILARLVIFFVITALQALFFGGSSDDDAEPVREEPAATTASGSTGSDGLSGLRDNDANRDMPGVSDASPGYR